MKINFEIPPSIRVTKNATYEVLYVDEFPNEKVLGECRYDNRQIVLKKGHTPLQTFSTFIHECIHAISFENDLNFTENQVLGLEEGIMRVLRLNGIVKSKRKSKSEKEK